MARAVFVVRSLIEVIAVAIVSLMGGSVATESVGEVAEGAMAEVYTPARPAPTHEPSR